MIGNPVKRWILLSILIPLSASALAQQQNEETEWDNTDKAMADYISDGFELKAVVENYSKSLSNPNGAYGIFHYLQKGNTLVRCIEIQKVVAGVYESKIYRRCGVNVRPHEFKPQQ